MLETEGTVALTVVDTDTPLRDFYDENSGCSTKERTNTYQSVVAMTDSSSKTVMDFIKLKKSLALLTVFKQVCLRSMLTRWKNELNYCTVLFRRQSVIIHDSTLIVDVFAPSNKSGQSSNNLSRELQPTM